MKKTAIFLIIILILNAFTDLKAQGKLRFGAKAGFNFSTLTTPHELFKLRPGFSAGAFVKYKLNDLLGIGLEPTYSMTGANKIDPLSIHFSDELLLNDFTGIPFKQHDLKFSTINLPIIATMDMKAGGMGLRLIAGASLDFILSTTQYSFREDVSIGETWLGNSSTASDVSKRFNYNDLAGIIGVGSEFSAGKMDLSVDVRYHHGFTDINNVAGKPIIKTRGFSLNVCVGLNKLILGK
jgi:hypothetical protein